VYVLQQLDSLVWSAVSRVREMEVSTLEIVDGGDASSINAVLASFPRAVAEVLDETGRAIGVDVRALLAPANPSPPSGGAHQGRT
jgi:flotillin